MAGQRQSTWLNADGLKVGFGPRSTEFTPSAPVALKGLKRELVYRFRGQDVGTTDPAEFQGDRQSIPAHAYVIRAYARVLEALDDDAVIDAVDFDGTVVEAGAFGTVPSATAVGDIVELSTGTFIGTSVGDANVFLQASGAATAGRVAVVVEYDVSDIPQKFLP